MKQLTLPEHPKEGDIYKSKTSSVLVEVSSVRIVNVPPPDSFDAAHPEEWHKEVVVDYRLNGLPSSLFDRTRWLWEFEKEHELVSEPLV